MRGFFVCYAVITVQPPPTAHQDTDHHQFKEMLKDRRQVLHQLLTKVTSQAPAMT